MCDSVPSARYSSVCNVLRQWRIWLIPTYRVGIESTDSMINTRLSTSGGYVLCQVYSNSDRQTDTFLNVFIYIIFIFTEYFRMGSGKPLKK